VAAAVWTGGHTTRSSTSGSESMAAPPRTAVRRIFDRLLVALFAAALAAPFVDGIARHDEARGPGPELRRPAPEPEFPRSLAALLAYPRAFENHWNDTFGLRDVLLRWHSLLKVALFGVSPDDRHVVGRELWIYNQNSDVIDNW